MSSESHDSRVAIDEYGLSDALLNAGNGMNRSSNLLLNTIAMGKSVFWTSLPQESHAHKLDIFRRLSNKENEIEDIMEPKHFDVTNCIISMARFTDAKGEQVITPKIVIIDDKGNSKSLLAKVWITEFIELFMVFGCPPWDTPIRVSAKSAKGNGANRYYTLVLP